MEVGLGIFVLGIVSMFGVVFSTQYCSTVTLGKVTSISCETGYHCCADDSKCCRDAGFLTNGVIAGITVGGVVVVVAVICMTICFVKSRSKKPTLETQQGIGQPDIDRSPCQDEHFGYDQNPSVGGRGSNPPPYSVSEDKPTEFIK